jgi:hypothetical protein
MDHAALYKSEQATLPTEARERNTARGCYPTCLLMERESLINARYCFAIVLVEERNRPRLRVVELRHRADLVEAALAQRGPQSLHQDTFSYQRRQTSNANRDSSYIREGARIHPVSLMFRAVMRLQALAFIAQLMLC